MTIPPRPALALLLATSLAALSACAEPAETPATEQQEAEAGTLTVSNARVVLPPVAGNPVAVYFDLSYSGPAEATLEAVSVEGAGMTMIHDYAESAGVRKMVMAGPVVLSENAPASFAPGGLHVMAMEPSAALEAGSTARITLTLSNGATTVVDAPVRAAGEDR